MAVAFSIANKDTYVDVEEVTGTGHVTITVETPDDTLTTTVDAGDLARALITASPTFTKGVGELAQKAILEFLGESESSVGE